MGTVILDTSKTVKEMEIYIYFFYNYVSIFVVTVLEGHFLF